jgi:hypothetical protein
MILIKLMKDTATIGLLMFSVVSDSCLSCAGKVLPVSEEERFLSYAVVSEDSCEPPTNCSVWLDCQLTCEQIFWEDVESNEEISDLAGVDQFRELCVQYCDTQYVLATEDHSNHSCSCGEECSCQECTSSCTIEDEICQ